MKHILTVLLCLLLCGCSHPLQTVPTEPAPQDFPDNAHSGMYDPNHPIETRYPRQVRGYPLTQRNVHGLVTFGSDVLILSGQENTTLMLLTGDDLHMTAAWTVGFPLSQDDPSLRFHDSCLSYFDPEQQETVLLDHRLQKIRSIAVPQGCSGKPILSADTNTLFYCTPWAVMAWDLESGIRRTVKEIQYTSQELANLCWQDQVLVCSVTEKESRRSLVLSVENGMELHSLPDDAVLETQGSGYFASWYDSFQNLTVFSREGSGPQLLLPEYPAEEQYYLGANQAVVTVHSAEDGINLDYYDLETGILHASVTLDKLQRPKKIAAASDHSVYILVYDAAADCDTIYRWNIPQQDPANSRCYTFPYPNAPDAAELDQCRQFADDIGRKYGIRVRIGEDACAIQPWDYQFAPETLAPVLRKELSLLDQRLSRYPQEILRQTASRFDGLTICLVRSIRGSEGADSLHTATGIQFLEGSETYVAITTGRYSEQALYHEFYHAMETQILAKSSALDQWEALNPADFSYGNPASDIYLQGQTRAFVDTYSMLSPKEDRARILENAILTGRDDLFRSEYMQRKLIAICLAIREAYGLKKTAEALPWEQYLVTALSPNA